MDTVVFSEGTEDSISSYLDDLGLRITCPTEKRHDSFTRRVNLLQSTDFFISF